MSQPTPGWYLEDKVQIPALNKSGELVGSSIVLEENQERTICRATCTLDDGQVFAGDDQDYWNALLIVRAQLEVRGILLKCYATCENLALSGMCIDMGQGLSGYLVKLGESAKINSMISIFKTSDEIVPVTIARQQDFTIRWEQSIGRRQV